MTPALQAESQKLAQSWERHEAEMLRDYLVADVEDPRLNVQSVLTRHFLLFSLFGRRFEALAREELRFAAAMNWWLALSKDPSTDPAGLLFGLRAGADNAEGVPLPRYLLNLFRELPVAAADVTVPNYLLTALETAAADERLAWPPTELDTFSDAWSRRLAAESVTNARVIEPACGSANDYRAFARYGLARLVRYSGFDLSPKNVANARALFPSAHFAVGNAFALPAADREFDFAVVHDLFEHLSLAGLECAVAEMCRVTRAALSVGFFNLDEVPDHVVRPVEDYHWNTLSLERTRAAFAANGFVGQVIHIGTFLRTRVGCPTTHNPNAYTFLLSRAAA